MIDHITFRVKNIESSIAFYTLAMKPLAYNVLFDQSFDNVRVVGFGKDGKNTVWLTNDTPVSGPFHVALKAGSKEEVDDFYRSAIDAGGKDNGAPGLRPEYHKNYYGAFVLDPGGNNIEAVFGN